MSLKAIKEVVELLAEDPGENHATLLAARDEIAALERAAPVAIAAFTGDIHVFKSDRIDECVTLLDAIAREAE